MANYAPRITRRRRAFRQAKPDPNRFAIARGDGASQSVHEKTSGGGDHRHGQLLVGKSAGEVRHLASQSVHDYFKTSCGEFCRPRPVMFNRVCAVGFPF